MLRVKEILVIIALCAAAVAGTGWSRLRLDALTLELREQFADMLYIPRGRALRLSALGFDAPLADALFVDGVVFYARAMENDNETWRNAVRRYTHALFDVITELSPRFLRAYQMGGLFLTSSSYPDAVLGGVDLLQKGVAAVERQIDLGTPCPTDPRWVFHSLSATAYDLNIQSNCLANGDREGAAEARRKAAQYYAKAAAMPGAPEYIRAAAGGYAARLSGRAGLEDSMLAMLSVWHSLYEQAQERGDEGTMTDLEQRITTLAERVQTIRQTREMERALSAMTADWAARTGDMPLTLDDMVREGSLRLVPPSPLADDDHADQWLVLPDGSVHSNRLAQLTTEHLERMMLDARMEYFRTTGKQVSAPKDLITAGVMDSLPPPPLAAWGQTWVLDGADLTLSLPLVWSTLP